MSKEFKISWHVFLDETNILEGRSLVEADTDSEAAQILIVEKTSEYRLRPNSVQIDALVEIVK